MTDLAWLNDLDMAKLLCQSPVPWRTTRIPGRPDQTSRTERQYTKMCIAGERVGLATE